MSCENRKPNGIHSNLAYRTSRTICEELKKSHARDKGTKLEFAVFCPFTNATKNTCPALKFRRGEIDEIKLNQEIQNSRN